MDDCALRAKHDPGLSLEVANRKYLVRASGLSRSD
jgi:hypothetical protein